MLTGKQVLTKEIENKERLLWDKKRVLRVFDVDAQSSLNRPTLIPMIRMLEKMTYEDYSEKTDVSLSGFENSSLVLLYRPNLWKDHLVRFVEKRGEQFFDSEDNEVDAV